MESTDPRAWRRVYTALFIDRTDSQLDALAAEVADRCGPNTTGLEIEAALRKIDEANDQANSTRAPRAGNIIRGIWSQRKGGASHRCVGFTTHQHRQALRDFSANALGMFEILPAKQGTYEALYPSQDSQVRQTLWYVDLIGSTDDRLKRWDMICAAQYAWPWLPGLEGCELAQRLCQEQAIAFTEYGPEHPVYKQRVAAIHQRLSKSTAITMPGTQPTPQTESTK